MWCENPCLLGARPLSAPTAQICQMHGLCAIFITPVSRPVMTEPRNEGAGQFQPRIEVCLVLCCRLSQRYFLPRDYIVSVYGTGLYADSSVYSRALCTGPRDYGTSRPVDSGRQYSGLYPVYIYRNTVHKYIQINHTGEIQRYFL